MAKGKSQDDIESMSFEQALEELKDIVSKLESGESKLEEAIDAYDRGARLKRHCESKLREAEAKIEKIRVGAGDEVKTEKFDAG